MKFREAKLKAVKPPAGRLETFVSQTIPSGKEKQVLTILNTKRYEQ